ncbi:MAG: hypothetical protein JSW27_03860 [Phycisphaerales bacterium]|nr:MAG: hypothetical protein JSW27_03860 [Phycisphaerales bacterium]
MNRMRWVPLAVCLLFQTAARADVYADLMAEEQAHVIRSQECVFNRDITVELEKGQALELKCPANEHGITKFIIYYHDMTIPGESEAMSILRADAWFENGETSGGGSRVSSERAMRQAGHSDCVMITQWQLVGDRIQVQFRAADDREFIRQRYQTWTSQGLHFSKAFRDRRFTPPVTLPEAERLAGFVQLWSEVKYNFAFFDQVPEIDWDEILTEYIPKVQAAETDVAYYKVLRQCIALLEDGHTGVWGPSDEPSYEPPLEVEAVRNQAVVVRVCPAENIKDKNLRDELTAAGVQVGDIVTHVDGRPVQEVLSQDIYPYQFASTTQALDRKAYPRLLRGAHGTKAELHIVHLDGSEAQVILTRGRYRFNRPANEFCRKTLDAGLVYVNLNSFGSDQVVKEFDEVFDRIKAAQGLILDVRRNGGGSSGHGYAILSRLIDDDVPGSHWRSRKHIAAHKAWGRKEQWQQGDHGTIRPHGSKRYTGPVVVLTSPDTASAAEDFVVAFQTARRGQVVGQKTCGSTGQPLILRLPGGGGARICTKRDSYPDGREFVGIGCLPDVEAEPTREDIAAGRDAVLEKAIEVLRSQIQ